MNKIPVGQTIGKAYRFAFGDFGAVIGAVWVPIAIAAVSAYFLFRNVEIPAFDDSNPDATARGIMGIFAVIMGPLRIWELVLWVCTIVVEIGLTRAALGIGRPTYAFFTLGPSFWRMLGANLIFFVILLIVMVPVILGVMLIVAITIPAAGGALGQGWVEQGHLGWVGVPLFFLVVAAFVGIYYVYARLWFFIAPVVVAEEHIDIRRGWHIAKGNVWRIIGIVLAVSLPGLFVLAAAEGAGFYTILSNVRFGGFPGAQLFSDNWPVFDAIFVVIMMCWIFLIALLHGSRAFAYRALVPERPTESTPESAA